MSPLISGALLPLATYATLDNLDSWIYFTVLGLVAAAVMWLLFREER